ncbi:baseplate J/gp47 family protein [uncultured Dysosmobacter sp.]|uniref:baseplate J/gp47 family protein n=1 Tax=uncultured Dysosmobacter sp. TaxID=2591384 RepID=UPI002621DE0F|nr:baseplate J/gp47 family protein [uncultured Dysosmobacter sp.]
MRSIEEIYQTMLGAFAERAGFLPETGCDLAVRLWAAAAEIQALGIQADWVLDQSFPQTAQGVYLDYHGTMRGLTRTPAAKAVGTLRFTVETAPAMDQTIPAGTVCMTAEETRFQTTESVVLATGSLFAEAPAEAVEAGSGGNVVPGTVTILTGCPVAVTGCVNPGAFSGGRDAEDDAAFRKRILESYQRLPNGANAAWYEQTAMEYPGVAAARAVGRARGIGTVDVYIAAENGLPAAETLTGLQAELQEKREIAVDVEVKAPGVQAVDVEVAVAVKPGADAGRVLALAEGTLTNFFSGRLLGKPVRLAELGSRIYALEGVENYRFFSPAADLAASDTVLPVLGRLQVTEMEA